ncbi:MULTISPECIES: MFS transporter [Nocardioides]|uniref:MFS transporter n=1 Tax=Nocardioides vastitatis TaxID=2568655 RepID=A0ABW0ZK04_9ACTN|nr:MFS transporter [Nocardioides sp.]
MRLRDPDRQPLPRAFVPGLVLLTTVTSIVSSLGAPLIPAIAHDADVSVQAAQWSLTLTMLVGAVTTPLMGRVGGGRPRSAVLAGLAVVATGLLLCALPLGFTSLLVGRALQGVGIALIPLAITVARDRLPVARVASIVGLLSVTTVAGSGLGYPVTAIVAAHAGIAAAFWLGFVLCCGTAVVAALTVPHDAARQRISVDVWGAVLLAAGTAGFLLALNRGEPWGWLALPTIGLASASGALLVLWVRRTLRIEHPLVDLRLAWGPVAFGANLTALVAGVAVYLMLSLIMLGTQASSTDGFGLGRGVVTAGLLLLPYSLLSLAGSRLAAMLGRHMRRDLVLPAGCVIYGASTVFVALFHANIWQLMLGMAFAGLGGGTTFAVMPALLLRGLPLAETGSALAFNMVLRFLGFAAGSALMPALVDLFAGDRPATHDTFTQVAFVGVALWVIAGVAAAATAAVVSRRPDAGAAELSAAASHSYDAQA